MQQGANIDEKKQEIINIHEVIRDKKIIPHFQSIVSVSRKKVCGLEGLARGINTETNQIISPMTLFHAAESEGVTLELDRACREKVIEAFSYIYKVNKDILLFLNIDASIIEKVEGSNYLMNQIKTYEINPSNIVIEINETKVHDYEALKRFINKYKNFGFMIALDDVGSGFSNLDRIPLAKPDIIKIDMSLIRNIHKDYYKQEVFKSLVNLSNKIGALIVAEGVETEEEAIQTLSLGGHMIQGFFFSKPQAIYEEPNILLNNKIEMLNNNFKKHMNKKIREEKQNYKQLNSIANNALTELVEASCEDFDYRLSEIVNDNNMIECAYVLDVYGIQLSNTISVINKDLEKDNLIFYSARMGTDHSMKKYYYHLINAKLKKYITEPYISLASGNMCTTVSRIFENNDNEKYILCMDFEICND